VHEEEDLVNISTGDEGVAVPLDDARAHPRSRLRTVVAAGVAALVVGLAAGLGGWALTGGGPDDSGAQPAPDGDVQFLPRSERPEPIPAGSAETLALAAPGDTFDPVEWIASVRATAAARPLTTGTLNVSVRRGIGGQPGEARQSISFSVASSGAYDIRFPGSASYATVDGAQVSVLDGRRLVQLRTAPLRDGRPAWVQPNGEIDLPNDAVSRMLYPDKWLEVMAEKNDFAVTFVGDESVADRATRRFRVTFGPDIEKYAPEGWDFWVDNETGALARYVIHYADSVGGGTEEAVVPDLDSQLTAPDTATIAVPDSYAVEAAVRWSGRLARLRSWTLRGETIAAFVERMRAAAAAEG
jgi:hypothetical protein